MPGIPTSFVVLEQTVLQLESSSDPAQKAIAKTITDHWEYAYLGALGAAIGDFLPSHISSTCKTAVDQQTKDNIPVSPLQCNLYLVAWQVVFGLVGGDAGLLAIIGQITSFLNTVAPLISAQDTSSLLSLYQSGQLTALEALAAQLITQVSQIKTKVNDLGEDIGSMRPVIEGFSTPPATPSLPPELWAVRDFLHWKKPGAFAKALVERARASGDGRFLAYAYGYLTSYAGKICGSPFINSIVAGPYRTQWWRHRWINNYVDAWVYGYYNLGMPVSWSGDIPTPNYPSWPSLCNANLHEKITLPDATAINAQDAMAKFGQWPPQEFATVLPNDFYQFWIGAYSDVYGAAPASLSFSEFNGAYILSWLILWFQTSAESLGCNQAPPMKPPVTCAKKPGWVQPAAEPGDNGSGQQPPTPNPKVTVSGGEEACGYLLAILGIALFDGFAGPPATAAFNGGVSLIVNAHVPDWNQLQCLLYWYQLYLYNGLDDVHQMGTLGAFLYPYASELAIGQVSIPFLVGLDQYDTGATLVKSLGPETNIQFPSMPWSSTSGGTWIRVPNSGQGNDPGVEAQHTVAYQDDGKYPSWFITDNPSAARIRGGGKWPEATSTPGVPAEFGSAVTEAVDLLTHLGDEFPNFNLDADRGQAYFTWQIPAGSYTPPTSPIGIGPES